MVKALRSALLKEIMDEPKYDERESMMFMDVVLNASESRRCSDGRMRRGRRRDAQVRPQFFSVDIEAYEISSCIVKPRTLFRYVGLPKAMVERVRAPSCASRLDRVRNVYYNDR